MRAYQFLLVCRVTAFGGLALCLFEFSRGVGCGALRFGHLRAVAREHGAAFRRGEESADGRKIFVGQGGAVAHGHGFFVKTHVGLRTALARARYIGNDLSVFEFDDAVGVQLGEFAVVRNDDDEFIGGKFFQRFQYLPARIRIERARRLVGVCAKKSNEQVNVSLFKPPERRKSQSGTVNNDARHIFDEINENSMKTRRKIAKKCLQGIDKSKIGAIIKA